jgi:hypothetical protein
MALIASPRIADPMLVPPFSARRKAHHIALSPKHALSQQMCIFGNSLHSGWR